MNIRPTNLKNITMKLLQNSKTKITYLSLNITKNQKHCWNLWKKCENIASFFGQKEGKTLSRFLVCAHETLPGVLHAFMRDATSVEKECTSPGCKRRFVVITDQHHEEWGLFSFIWLKFLATLLTFVCSQFCPRPSLQKQWQYQEAVLCLQKCAESQAWYSQRGEGEQHSCCCKPRCHISSYKIRRLFSDISKERPRGCKGAYSRGA